MLQRMTLSAKEERRQRSAKMTMIIQRYQIIWLNKNRFCEGSPYLMIQTEN